MAKKSFRDFASGLKKGFGKFIQSVRKGYEKIISKYDYDLWKEMNSNDIALATFSDEEAVKWYKRYRGDRKTHYKDKMLIQGMLYMFDYKNPKYKDVLDFYDTNPLVISLGKTHSVEDSFNNIGINLHLLPPRIRRIVLFEIFYTFRGDYRSILLKDLKRMRRVRIDYRIIVKKLEKYGVKFAIRSYIPSRQTNKVMFALSDWERAIWIPSAGYAKMGPEEIEKKWKEFVKTSKNKLVGGESHYDGSV